MAHKLSDTELYHRGYQLLLDKIWTMSYHEKKQRAVDFLESVIKSVDTCINLRNMSDEDIAISIFEDLDGSVDYAWFCFTTGDLSCLMDHWLVSEEVYNKLLSLGDWLRDMTDNRREKWEVEAVRTDSEWADIIELAKEIKSLLDENDC